MKLLHGLTQKVLCRVDGRPSIQNIPDCIKGVTEKLFGDLDQHEVQTDEFSRVTLFGLCIVNEVLYVMRINDAIQLGAVFGQVGGCL